ncbi:MAG: GH3 auxin-responsive promoter family protein [Desulfobacteraceae bacterium]|nr:GH3 auxin-responsive promoter family protein [Desulfobacteraceae bacterium]
MIDVTPIIRQYSRFRLNQLKKQNISAIQKFQMLKLLKKAESTLFGRQYGFRNIRTVEHYQRIVPLRTYEDFWDDFWGRQFPNLTDCTWTGKTPFFAITTGTTKKSKNIPLSEEMIRSNSKASFDLFSHHIANRPRSRILGGEGCMTGISNFRQLSPNVCVGSLPDILTLQRHLQGKTNDFRRL